jgi:N-acetylglucosaminyl-diphospho-decaprenol L-rhamnosyltransferase
MSTTAIASDSTIVGSPAGSARALRPLNITVIIVTYKSAQLTIRALKSLLTERASPTLCVSAIVIDNASGDLPEIARAVEDCGWSAWVTLILASRNGGFAYGNNLGIERACGSATLSYVYLLNPDTEVRPGAIASLVRFLESHRGAGIAGSSFETLDGAVWPIAFRFPTLVSELNQGLAFGIVTRLLERWITVRRMGPASEQVDWISGASVMIRPEVFAAIGGLDENYFLYFEETDFCRRARAAGFATWYVPESRVMHIGGESTAISERTLKRLPSYWFESRRRYFVVTFGLLHAMVIDVVAIVAHFLGLVKRSILGRRHTAIPYYIRDLASHSVFWKRNRHIPPARCRIPSLKTEALQRSVE